MTKIDKHVPGTVTWVDLMTTDPTGVQKFYGELFGWTFDIGGPETNHYAMAKLGGANVGGVGPQPPGAQFPPAWSVYFASDDVDATIAKVKELGGNLVMGPMDVMEEGRLAFFADPTGAHFGVWQAKRHHGAQVIDEPGAMCWHEVATPDAAKARDFYCRLFGLEPQKMQTDQANFEYYTLHKGPKVVGGVLQMTKEWAGVPPHWMSYFAVADTDDAAKKITALGGKVSVPPFDTPYGRIAVVNDPSGAVFSIIKQSRPA
jgi:predicted enzyme related to lactoylglutathione lyase